MDKQRTSHDSIGATLSTASHGKKTLEYMNINVESKVCKQFINIPSNVEVTLAKSR